MSGSEIYEDLKIPNHARMKPCSNRLCPIFRSLTMNQPLCQTCIFQHPVGDGAVICILFHFLSRSPSSPQPRPLTMHIPQREKLLLIRPLCHLPRIVHSSWTASPVSGCDASLAAVSCRTGKSRAVVINWSAEKGLSECFRMLCKL